MNTVSPEHPSSASFGSNSMNPSSDYTSNQSSNFTPRPSRVVDTPTAKFPFPTMEDTDPDKRRSPVRRASKFNLLSKLFSSSKRDIKESKKSVRDLDKEKSGDSHQSTKKTASSTTLHLSQDAAQVFGNLRHHQGDKIRRELVRQKSEDSMIGSVLEIPSSESSTLEDTANEVPMEAPSTPPRAKIPERASSFRTPKRSNEFYRTPSMRSVSFQADRSTISSPVIPPRIPSNEASTARSVEISPGNFQVLRGHQETLRYVREDEVASTTCLFCSDTIYAINDAAMVICPTCRSISPMREDGDGLALGFTAHEWLEIQREALAMH